MQNKSVNVIGKDTRVIEFGKCLEASGHNLVKAGKLLVILRHDIPDCDAVLLELFPNHLTQHVLNRLVMCGSNKIIPAFVHIFGSVANKLKELPLRVQKQVFMHGVDVVVGGTASKPVSRNYGCMQIMPGHAAQVFDGKKVRSIAEQVAFRAAKAKMILAPYTATVQCFVANRKCRIDWNVLKDVVDAHFSIRLRDTNLRH